MSSMMPPAAGFGGAPPGLAALLAQGPPPGQDSDDQVQPAQDGGLSKLQDVLNDFPALLANLSDPQDVDLAVQAMRNLTTIQRRLMGAQSGPAAQGG